MLIELIPRMTEQLKDLTNQRNYHQLDRDAIDGFRNLSLAEVTKLDNESSMKDVELADLIENHRVELEVYAHKVREPARPNLGEFLSAAPNAPKMHTRKGWTLKHSVRYFPSRIFFSRFTCCF